MKASGAHFGLDLAVRPYIISSWSNSCRGGSASRIWRTCYPL